MDLVKVSQLLNDDDAEMQIFFTEKDREGYISKIAQLDPNRKGNVVESELKGFLTNAIDSIRNSQFEVKEYDPTMIQPDVLETTNLQLLGQSYSDILESFQTADNNDLEEMADDYTFYTVDVAKEDDELRIYRRVKKFRKIYSKGLLAQFHGNTITKVDNKIIGLDGEIDLIEFNQQILILNHISLERIFRLEDTFSNTASKALNQLKKASKITNFGSFEEDCLNDLRIQKTLTRMSGENIDWVHSLDHFANVINTIDTFDLGIDYQQSPDEKIIYDGNKGHLTDILRIVRDSYYQTMVNQKYGKTDYPQTI